MFWTVLCGVIFFFGVLTFLILQREKEFILSHYEETTSRFVDLVFQDLVFMMTEDNPTAVARNIRAFNDSKDMEIGVVKENGLPAFGTGIEIPKEVFEAQKTHNLISGNEFIFFKPLANSAACHGCHSPKDRTRGMIVIKTSMEKARADIAETAKRLVVIALFLGLASELFLMTILRKMLLRPIEKLNKGAMLLKDGKLDHRVRLGGNDEISALGDAFNQMADHIEASHLNLEKTVLEKTGELREIAGLSAEVFKGDITLRTIIDYSLTTIVDKMGYDYSVFCLVEKETGLLFQEVRRGIDEGFCDMEIPLGSDHPFATAIRQARATIKSHADLGIPETFGNLAIIPLLSHQRKQCREVNLCSFEECPAFRGDDERCWLVSGTLCRSPRSVPGKEKIYNCLHCPVFPVIGVLIAGRKGEISPTSLHSLNILTAEIASAIENQRLIAGKKEDIRKMVALNDISAEALHVPGAPISKTIVSYATRFSNTDAAILWLADEDHKTLRKAGSFRIDEDLVPESLPLTDSFVGESLHMDRCTETITMEKVRCFGDLIGNHGFLYAASIPLKVRDSLLGCLTVFKKRDFFMTDSEKAIMLLFATQAAAALNTSRLYASLSESEEKYRVIMNDAADAIFLFDVEGKILDANRKAEEFTGYPRAELFLKHYYEFLPQEDRIRASEAFSETLSDGMGAVNNLSLLRGDSTALPVDVTGSMVEVGGERILLAIVRDITERRQTEEVLYTINERFSGSTGKDFFLSVVTYLGEILNMAYVYIGELTEDAQSIRTLAVSAHGRVADNFTYPLAGTPCNNVIGKKLRSYVSGVRELFPEDRMLVDMDLESYIGIPLFSPSGHKPLGIIVAADGRPVVNLKFAEFTFQLFAVRTSAELERLQVEKTLLSACEFSDAIFNCAASGIMVMDREGRVIKINHFGASILRLPMHELIGKRITDIYPETKDLFFFGMGLGREITIALPDGDSIPVGFTNSLLDYSQDALECTIVLFRDLTEIKKLQEELRRKEYYGTMGMIISGVAHEVRNPLFGITSIGQILERELQLPQHKALTQAMLKEAGRMKRLIDELLLYTRPATLNIQSIDASGLFEEIIDQTGATSDRISLSVDMHPGVKIRVDRDKIIQVFLHLLNNAIDAAKNRVTISVLPRKDLVEIRIVDDGAGINKEHINRIYEPFFTTKKGGTGLGLAICKKIVEDHDGSITIDSLEGKGTTVTLLLKA